MERTGEGTTGSISHRYTYTELCFHLRRVCACTMGGRPSGPLSPHPPKPHTPCADVSLAWGVGLSAQDVLGPGLRAGLFGPSRGPLAQQLLLLPWQPAAAVRGGAAGPRHQGTARQGTRRRYATVTSALVAPHPATCRSEPRNGLVHGGLLGCGGGEWMGRGGYRLGHTSRPLGSCRLVA